MADNSKKVSELPTTTNAASTDRILILRSPASNASVRTITANDFANSTKLSFANIVPDTIVTTNSVNIASNGTSNVAFFSYTVGAGKTGCLDMDVHAKDESGLNASIGKIYIVGNTSAISETNSLVQIGPNIILFDVDPILSSNVITLYFTRNSATTSNVTIRYAATIY